MLQSALHMLFELPAGLLKGGGIDVEVEFRVKEPGVSHGVGQSRKQRVDVFMRLTPTRDASAGVIVTQVMQPRGRVSIDAALETEPTEDAVRPIAFESSARPRHEQRRGWFVSGIVSAVRKPFVQSLVG